MENKPVYAPYYLTVSNLSLSSSSYARKNYNINPLGENEASKMLKKISTDCAHNQNRARIKTKRIASMANKNLERVEEDLKKALLNDEDIEKYLREFDYPDLYEFNDEQFAALVANLQAVWKYILTSGQWNARVINGDYEPAVMALVIIETLINDGYLDEITEPEAFYSFCVTFTEREYSIPAVRNRVRAYEACCLSAAKKIAEILKDGEE